MEGPEQPLDETALVRLYERLERPIYNVVYRFLWTSEDSQDAVQETFLRLWRMRHQVRTSTVEPLLYRIAINVATSRLRKRRVWRWISLEVLRSRASPNPGAEELVGDAEVRLRVRRAVESLPMDLRKVIVLCELAELSYQQVADGLEIPVGTVGSRRHRALELLRRKLGGDQNAE
jgi:RNA polymerase sigma-70 factor (ECF subfamily)